jgi:predicted phosphodiesterase
MGRKKKKKKSMILRILFRTVRGAVAIVILAALVLGVSYGVGKLSKLNPVQLFRVSSTFLSSFGVSKDVTEKIEQGLVESPVEIEYPEDSNVPEVSGATAEDFARQEDIVVRVALFADSHLDWDALSAAIEKVKELEVDMIFHVGDHSNLGIVKNLEKTKDLLDASELSYYAIPGDRDLWQTVGTDNFLQVFKENRHTVTKDDIVFVLMDNSANYSTVEDSAMEWFEKNVADADFIFLSQPLWHPTNSKVMGYVNGDKVENVRIQAEELLKKVRESEVLAVFAGDQHMFSKNLDSEKESLVHYALGALTSERNLQTPRFALLDIGENAQYSVKQVILGAY